MNNLPGHLFDPNGVLRSGTRGWADGNTEIFTYFDPGREKCLRIEVFVFGKPVAGAAFGARMCRELADFILSEGGSS